MRKVFLYLYPIEEYNRFSKLWDKKACDEHSWRLPLEVLNECFQKRYRDKGYEVVIAQYPDKETYGVDLKPEDRIIYTDITFKEASGYNEDKSEKPSEEIKYPNEEYLLKQIGPCDELVIGGFHFNDCVKRVNAAALGNGINSTIDPEMTDLFFHLYHQKYFNIEEYSPEAYEAYLQLLNARRYKDDDLDPRTP